jgi:hypothetical protein
MLQRAVAYTFSRTFDGKAEPNPRLIQETLRFRWTRLRQIPDSSEAQIPSFMQIGLLGELPNPLQLFVSKDLDVNSWLLAHEPTLSHRVRQQFPNRRVFFT